MLLFPELVFALCLSLLLVGLVFFRGKTITSVSVADVADRRTKHTQLVKLDDGFSKDCVFSGSGGVKHPQLVKLDNGFSKDCVFSGSGDVKRPQLVKLDNGFSKDCVFSGSGDVKRPQLVKSDNGFLKDCVFSGSGDDVADRGTKHPRLVKLDNGFSKDCVFSGSGDDLTERIPKHPQLEILDNGYSKDCVFGGAECSGRVFDESLVGPGWVDDVEEDYVRFPEKVGFVRDVFDDIHVRPECDEIVDEDNVEILEVADYMSEFPKEGIFSRVEFEKAVLGETSSEFMIESGENEGDAEVLKVAVLESEVSKECVEFEEHIVDECPERPKTWKLVTALGKGCDRCPERPKKWKLVTGLGKSCDNVEELQEVKVLGSQISENIVSSGIECDASSLRAKSRNLLIKPEKKKDTKLSENEEDDDEEGLLDDWEGIESTELEKMFGEAVVFVGSRGNAHHISSFSNEVKMQLYGLYKVAIEGPCCVQKPLAFKVSARAKWNAWHLLGDMSQEVAMEQYVTLLSESLPEWRGDALKVSLGVKSSTYTVSISAGQKLKCAGRTGDK